LRLEFRLARFAAIAVTIILERRLAVTALPVAAAAAAATPAPAANFAVRSQRRCALMRLLALTIFVRTVCVLFSSAELFGGWVMCERLRAIARSAPFTATSFTATSASATTPAASATIPFAAAPTMLPAIAMRRFADSFRRHVIGRLGFLAGGCLGLFLVIAFGFCRVVEHIFVGL
jgi:hypothetical protein